MYLNRCVQPIGASFIFRLFQSYSSLLFSPPPFLLSLSLTFVYDFIFNPGPYRMCIGLFSAPEYGEICPVSDHMTPQRFEAALSSLIYDLCVCVLKCQPGVLVMCVCVC